MANVRGVVVQTEVLIITCIRRAQKDFVASSLDALPCCPTPLRWHNSIDPDLVGSESSYDPHSSLQKVAKMPPGQLARARHQETQSCNIYDYMDHSVDDPEQYPKIKSVGSNSE